MALRKTLTYVVPTMLLIGVAGQANANIFFPNYGELENKTFSGSTFNDELAKEYRSMTMYEWNEMRDYIDAEYYASKALMAGEQNRAPAPSNPDEWDIDQETARQELNTAHAELVKALSAGAPTIAPREAAVAQTKFDCWVEQQEEGWQFDEIAACRDQFRTAMADLNAAMAPKPAVSAAPAQNTTLVATDMTEIDRTVVYFDFDKATITPDAQAELDRFVKSMQGLDNIKIFVEGHADKAGPADYNEKLSERRAAAVRAELDRQGMPLAAVDEVRVEAEGETRPAVNTADGVREPLNRRVVVIANGVAETTKIQPMTTSSN